MLEKPLHSETIGRRAEARKGRCGFAQRPEMALIGSDGYSAPVPALASIWV